MESIFSHPADTAGPGRDNNNNNNNTNSSSTAIVTSTPNKSQIAIQVMHCVLGKSGVCTPFLHEQAYVICHNDIQHGM